jgi:DNA-binding response OmpR family regulator
LYVLVVNGDTAAADVPLTGLRRHRYTAELTRTGRAALQRYHKADLVLLDPDLPDVDGLEVCRSIRAQSDIPIIMLTSRASELDHVLGLRAGADDYLVSPVSVRELIARIEAVSRRARADTVPRRNADGIMHGRLRIDVKTRSVLLDDRPVDVTRKEFDLLHVLASQPQTVVSRHQLMDSVWKSDGVRTAGSRTLDTHVNSLRSKLGAREWILTVRGVGFRLGPGGVQGQEGRAAAGSDNVSRAIG